MRNRGDREAELIANRQEPRSDKIRHGPPGNAAGLCGARLPGRGLPASGLALLVRDLQTVFELNGIRRQFRLEARRMGLQCRKLRFERKIFKERT